jgi:hypothetical protein
MKSMRKLNRSVKRKTRNLTKNKSSKRVQNKNKNKKLRKAAFKMIIKSNKNVSATMKRLKKQRKRRKASKKAKRGKKQKGGYSSFPAPLPCLIDTDGISYPDWDSNKDAAYDVGVCSPGSLNSDKEYVDTNGARTGLQMIEDGEVDADDAYKISDDDDVTQGRTVQAMSLEAAAAAVTERVNTELTNPT